MAGRADRAGGDGGAAGAAEKDVPPGTVHAVGAGGAAAAAAGEPDGGKPGELTGRGSAGEPGVPRHAGGEDKRPGGGGSRACGILRRRRCGRTDGTGGGAGDAADVRPVAAVDMGHRYGLHGGVYAAELYLDAADAAESGAHSGQRVPLHPVEHALCAGHYRAVHLCAGERVGGGSAPGAGPRAVPHPAVGSRGEALCVPAAGGELVQPGAVGGLCPAGAGHGERL